MTNVNLNEYYPEIDRYQSLLGVKYFNLRCLDPYELFPPRCAYEVVSHIEFSVNFQVTGKGVSGKLAPICGLLSAEGHDSPTFMSKAAINALLSETYVPKDEVLTACMARVDVARARWVKEAGDRYPRYYLRDELEAWEALYSAIEGAIDVKYIWDGRWVGELVDIPTLAGLKKQ